MILNSQFYFLSNFSLMLCHVVNYHALNEYKSIFLILYLGSETEHLKWHEMLFIKLLRRVTSNMAVESGLDFLGGLCAIDGLLAALLETTSVIQTLFAQSGVGEN